MTLSKEIMARRLWLHYFNRVLLERGLITREEYGRLSQRISGIGRE